MEPLPYEIVEAMVQVFGRSFHFKDGMAAFLQAAGVPKRLIEKYRAEHKYPWARKVLTELADGDDGRLIQRRVLTNLCQLRNLPDDKVPDRAAGLDALRNLKHLALEHHLVVAEERSAAKQRQTDHEARAKLIAERATKLQDLRGLFFEQLTAQDRQAAGYSLEDILKDLFALFEIEFRKSYRTEMQQIDGHFNLDGFDYLVEARWRHEFPTEADVAAFKHKVDTKLESTRGFFVSVPGFRPDVIDRFANRGANIIFMDGADLTFVLEGRMDLRDALRLKVERAAQLGIPFHQLGR